MLSRTSSMAEMQAADVRSGARSSSRRIPKHADAAMAQDPRHALAMRIAASRGFARSPLLSRFLLYVVEETVQGRTARLSEHPIGVAVFARPRGYRTEEDNIVRNYARQLRRRLAEYFAGEGRDEPVVLEIPTGGYVPQFVARVREAEPEKQIGNDKQEWVATGEEQNSQENIEKQQTPFGDDNKVSGDDSSELVAGEPLRRVSGREALAVAALVLWMLGIVGMAGWGTLRAVARGGPVLRTAALRGTGLPGDGGAGGERPVAHALWSQLFAPGSFTDVVPPDAGFNLMEDAAQTNLSVADYMQGGVATMELAGLNVQTAKDLRTEEFTDFASAQIAAEVMRLPEYPAHGAALRFPRDLRLDDLRDGNVILIGSVLSNPWSALVDGRLNFRIEPEPGMRGASVVNRQPQPGERLRYDSHWHEAEHDTWGIVALERNLSGKGWILLLEGLDVAGTQSAADFVMGSQGMRGVVDKARQADGTLEPFEILLHTRSLQSHAEGVEVVAMRVGEPAE